MRVLVHEKDRRNRHGGLLFNGSALCDALRECGIMDRCSVFSLRACLHTQTCM